MVKVILKYLGHASFKIKVNSKIIYLDPYAGKYDEKADIILVTHSHRDHCDPMVIKSITRDNTIILGPKSCLELVKNIRILEVGEKVECEGVEVKAVHAYNVRRFRSPGNPYHPKGFGIGYLIGIYGKNLYHAGDTDLISEMEELNEIQIAMLPIGGKYTMDVDEAVEAVAKIKPELAIPMHMRDRDPEEFKRKVEEETETKVIILKPGEAVEI